MDFRLFSFKNLISLSICIDTADVILIDRHDITTFLKLVYQLLNLSNQPEEGISEAILQVSKAFLV